MGSHVDVVVNRWMVGEQAPVARVHIDGAALAVDSPDPDRWSGVVDRVLGELANETPEHALEKIATVLSGSHLFATRPHDEGDCPFHGGWQGLPAESVALRQLVSA